MKLLVTGFEAFGGEDRNPTLELLPLLPGRRGPFLVETLALPVVFGEAAEVATDAIRRLRPQAVLMLGQAGGRVDIAVERVAINLDDARMADNKGNQPFDRPIDPKGPAALFSTFSARAIVETMRAAGVPASLSYSAGTFVCNHLLYSVLRFLEAEWPAALAGFLHFPWLPEQAIGKAGQPSMPLELARAGVLAAIDAMAADLDGGDQESLREATKDARAAKKRSGSSAKG
jgi:pyroglutamyl-peptidase